MADLSGAQPSAPSEPAALADMFAILRDRLTPPTDPDQLALSPADAARVLGVSRATFFKMHSAGKLPLPVYLTSRCPRWSRAELVAWLEAGAPDRQTWEKAKGGKR